MFVREQQQKITIHPALFLGEIGSRVISEKILMSAKATV